MSDEIERRRDGRKPNELRPIQIERHYLKYPEGSVLIEWGETKVIVNVSAQTGVPRWLRGSGQGWITAEYSMLPRATQNRNIREVQLGKQGGRTVEIQRLIGRCLRAVVELDGLGENTMWVDCDVIQADGGTRTAALTGAFVAMVDALYFLMRRDHLRYLPLNNTLAAVSCGIVDGVALLDLPYEEDSRAQVDMNVIGTGTGHLIEVQGGAESHPFSPAQLQAMMDHAYGGLKEITRIQRDCLGNVWDEVRAGIARLEEGMNFAELRAFREGLENNE